MTSSWQWSLNSDQLNLQSTLYIFCLHCLPVLTSIYNPLGFDMTDFGLWSMINTVGFSRETEQTLRQNVNFKTQHSAAKPARFRTTDALFSRFSSICLNMKSVDLSILLSHWKSFERIILSHEVPIAPRLWLIFFSKGSPFENFQILRRVRNFERLLKGP